MCIPMHTTALPHGDWQQFQPYSVRAIVPWNGVTGKQRTLGLIYDPFPIS